MTMLDRMRRHRNWLKWSLGLVCLAFVIFYIPDFLRGSATDASSGDTVASVEGRRITSGEFRKTYQTQLQAYRSAYGGQMSEQLLKQLGIEQQILQQIVDEQGILDGRKTEPVHQAPDGVTCTCLITGQTGEPGDGGG